MVRKFAPLILALSTLQKTLKTPRSSVRISRKLSPEITIHQILLHHEKVDAVKTAYCGTAFFGKCPAIRLREKGERRVNKASLRARKWGKSGAKCRSREIESRNTEGGRTKEGRERRGFLGPSTRARKREKQRAKQEVGKARAGRKGERESLVGAS